MNGNADLIADAVETASKCPTCSDLKRGQVFDADKFGRCPDCARVIDEWYVRVNNQEGVIAGRSYPDNNPKAAIGETKCPLHLVPPALAIGVAEAMKNGADKYGSYNFRESKIAASVYMGAILRHLYAWWDGEDCASDSGIDHLKHIGASIALMLDAKAAGTFDDDRPAKGGAAELLEQYNNG